MGRSRDNVDFGRLMSQDYQREWLEQRERKQQQHKEKLKVSQTIQKCYCTLLYDMVQCITGKESSTKEETTRTFDESSKN